MGQLVHQVQHAYPCVHKSKLLCSATSNGVRLCTPVGSVPHLLVPFPFDTLFVEDCAIVTLLWPRYKTLSPDRPEHEGYTQEKDIPHGPQRLDILADFQIEKLSAIVRCRFHLLYHHLSPKFMMVPFVDCVDLVVGCNRPLSA